MRKAEYTRMVLAGLIAAACLGAPTIAAEIEAPAGGQVRALIVGIDNYASVRRLKGAVADARDLSAALSKRGVRDVKTLIDQDAVRPALLAEFDRLVNVSQPKDLVLISFAGHGSRRPESVPHSKPDGMDEAYILQRFDPSSAARNPDLIIGPEMKHYLAKLEAKDVDVIFIADTCHGGGMTRRPDPRSGEVSYRTSDIGAAAEAMLDAVYEPTDAMRNDSSFNKVTFLAAVDKFSKAPEVDIPGQPTKRGALSYAVARALEGRIGQAGVVSRADLFGYARQVVAQYARQKQTIVTEPTSGVGAIEAAVWRGEAAPPPAAEQISDAARPVRVAVNGDPSALAGMRPNATPFVLVADMSAADLVWDSGTREVIVAGDVIAHDVSPRDVPAVVDRVKAVADVSSMSERRPQYVQLLPNDRLHYDGEALILEARDLQDRYAVIFNVTGAGTVQFLFPDPDRRDPERIRSGVWRLPIKVAKPFGADTVIAVTSDQPLSQLARELGQLDNRSAAVGAIELLRRSLPSSGAVRVGFASIFTAP